MIMIIYGQKVAKIVMKALLFQNTDRKFSGKFSIMYSEMLSERRRKMP